MSDKKSPLLRALLMVLAVSALLLLVYVLRDSGAELSSPPQKKSTAPKERVIKYSYGVNETSCKKWGGQWIPSGKSTDCGSNGCETKLTYDCGVSDRDKTVAACDQEERPQSDSCYVMAAKFFDEIHLCEHVADPQQCYFEVAPSAKDPEACRRIDDAKQADYCFRNLAMFLNDAEICELINDKSVESNYPYCIVQIASELDDISLCPKIQPIFSNSYDRCWRKVKVQEPIDDSLCDGLTDEFAVEKCLEKVKAVQARM